MESVTSVLVDRAREPRGLRPMIGVSLAAHVAAFAVILLTAGLWGNGADERDAKAVMTITLGGGAPGPRTGGLNPIGGRPIQTVAPMPDPKRPEPVRPPAAKKPEMTAPSPTAKKAPPTPEPETAPPDRGWAGTPTRGEEIKPGAATAETGGQGTGWGLSTGGVGGAGSYLEISGDFCCPDYVTTMLALVQRNWQGKQGATGATMVKYSILRDGRIVGIQVEKSSGSFPLDLAAQRALYNTRLPPLPAAFGQDRLTVHLVFEYTR